MHCCLDIELCLIAVSLTAVLRIEQVTCARNNQHVPPPEVFGCAGAAVVTCSMQDTHNRPAGLELFIMMVQSQRINRIKTVCLSADPTIVWKAYVHSLANGVINIRNRVTCKALEPCHRPTFIQEYRRLQGLQPIMQPAQPYQTPA